MPARRKTAKASGKPGDLPSRDEVLAYVRGARGKIGKREIAKAFGIRGGPARSALKALLADMVDEGLIAGGKKELRAPGELPPVTIIVITGTDADGELIGEPVKWNDDDGPRPKVLVEALSSASRAGRGRRAARPTLDRPLGEGDEVLANISTPDGGVGDDGIAYIARPIKRLPKSRNRMLGVYRRAEHGGLIAPVDKKQLREWPVRRDDQGDAKDGDLVRFDLLRSGRAQVSYARVTEVLGNPADQRQISLIAVHAHGIPDTFPEPVLDELETLPEIAARGREDLTDLAFVTIDPPDARDHDDAVCVARDTAEDNPGGAIVTVAIADVAAYVGPGTALDREAAKRGNSCYFPDRVVPMLPERISNDLCSLRAGEIRPSFVVRMRFDRNGNKRAHTFHRALIKVAAKLSYAEAQEVFNHFETSGDGTGAQPTTPDQADAHHNTLADLWWGYTKLAKARDRRGPLDLDLPERKIVLDDRGRVTDIVTPERLPAHRLIEEFMIQANVAAAETLETKKVACVYRVHAPPSKEKLEGLREFLDSLGLKLPAQNVLKPNDINAILDRAKSLPVPQLVSEVVLRAQSQAEYAVENVGHFGLNLRRYAHFTSPIRRYADLLVHRGLVTALGLGDDGLETREVDQLADLAAQISQTERRAMAAERETFDRYTASFLAERIGAQFKGRVSGVVRSGLFVRLDETGADGFVPAGSLAGDGWYDYEESLHALVDLANGRGFRLGDAVTVRLLEVAPLAGALRFEILSDPGKISLALAKGYRGRSGGRRLGQRRSRRRS